MITLQPMNICQAAADLLWSRVIKEFPDIRFALSEGGTGWIPYFIDRLDRTYDMHHLWTGQDFGDRLPSDVFREHFLTCFIADPVGIQLRHLIGLDNIAWECDYPHSDSSWPEAPEELALVAADVPDDELNKISYENACRWYSFDPFAVRLQGSSRPWPRSGRKPLATTSRSGRSTRAGSNGATPASTWARWPSAPPPDRRREARYDQRRVPVSPSPLDAFDLRDRVAVVTGGQPRHRAGGGAWASPQWEPTSSSPAERPRRARKRSMRFASAGGSALAVPTHVGRLDELGRLVERTVDAFGGIDIVVNNAANPLTQPLGAITPEAFAKSYEANVRGPLFLVQEALPYLRASSRASVINVITAGVFTHGTGVSLYVSAKSALLSFTRSMASEFAADGIRVNAVAPGAVATQMTLNLPPERQEAVARAQLMPRLADPDELVPGMLFLASDASSFMTGQVLVLDGGLTVP